MKKKVAQMPKKQLRKQLRFSPLVYGYWVTSSGEEVLFSRSHDPLWARQPGQQATPEDRDRWVNDIVQHAYFWDDWSYQFVKKNLPQIVADFVAGKPVSSHAMTTYQRKGES
jgi:hypothetical protein